LESVAIVKALINLVADGVMITLTSAPNLTRDLHSAADL